MKSIIKKSVRIGLIFLSIQIIHISSVDAAYYRWTDENGKTHYSSSIPPDKAKLGHVELDRQGLKKEVVVSAQKKQQLEEIAKEKEKEKEEEKIAAEKKKKQDAEDNLLLSVFNNEDELVESYDSKLELAQVNINLLKRRQKTQAEKLEVLEQKYEKTTSVKHKQLMKKQIDTVLENLKIFQQAITENLIEKDKLNDDYKNTLERFRELLVRQVDKN